jgi:hypothetical protein
MTISRSEDLLVGLISAGLVGWIGWTVARGLRGGRLPIGRSYVRRSERRAPFIVLLIAYGFAAIAAAIIALDLLFNIKIGW